MAKKAEQAFRGKIKLQYDLNDKRTDIMNENIIYIVIDYDLTMENSIVTPIILVSMSLPSNLCDKIIKNKDKGQFYLSIKIDNVLSTSSVPEKYFARLFDYITSVATPNIMDKFNSKNKGTDLAYQNITVGLIMSDKVDYLRTPVNDVYRNIDQTTLVALAVGKKKSLIEPLKYNNTYSQILIPPLDTRYQFLQYIFEDNPFYDTEFRYFIDFDTTYLLSKSGNKITKKDNTVNIYIKEVTDGMAYSEGITKNKDTYSLYIHANDAKYDFNDDKIGFLTNEVIAYEDDTPIAKLQVNASKSTSKKKGKKKTYVRTSDGNIVKNQIDEGDTYITIMKKHIDGNMLTPEKEYNIKNYGEYKKFDGRYILIYKRIIYRGSGGSFQPACIMAFKLVSNNEPKKSKNTSTKKQTGGASKSTTASSKNTNNSQKRSEKNK